MVPSGKRLQKTMENHHFLMGKLTISMAIFNSYVTNYQRDPEGNSNGNVPHLQIMFPQQNLQRGFVIAMFDKNSE